MVPGRSISATASAKRFCGNLSHGKLDMRFHCRSRGAMVKNRRMNFQIRKPRYEPNCGLAATWRFENSIAASLIVHLLSTNHEKLLRVLEFELIRTRERKRERPWRRQQ